jgi:NAD(P)H-hydrate repair Nnr-like enzyme with NAD(P)H-hydrate epimerase domain
VANAVVERCSGALGTGFEVEVKLVALVVGVGKDEGDAIVAAHLAGEEVEFTGGVDVGSEGEVFG